MQREDAAGRRWARDISAAHLRFWADRTRHARLCNQRGAIIQKRAESTTCGLVLDAWRAITRDSKRRGVVEAVLA